MHLARDCYSFFLIQLFEIFYSTLPVLYFSFLKICFRWLVFFCCSKNPPRFSVLPSHYVPFLNPSFLRKLASLYTVQALSVAMLVIVLFGKTHIFSFFDPLQYPGSLVFSQCLPPKRELSATGVFSIPPPPILLNPGENVAPETLSFNPVIIAAYSRFQFPPFPPQVIWSKCVWSFFSSRL